jgi:hypothetical protein
MQPPPAYASFIGIVPPRKYAMNPVNPGTPFGLLLIASGGVLVWGVDDNVAALNLGAIGVILILVGAVSLIMSLLFWSTVFGGTNSVRASDPVVVRERRRPTVIVDDRDPEPVVTERYERVTRDEPGHHHV